MRINIMWFRRDLRLEDNAALFHALNAGLPVLPFFIFDRTILDKLENKADRRVEFIRAALEEMQVALVKTGSSLLVLDGIPTEVFASLANQYEINTVFTNHDYEPDAIERDTAVAALLANRQIAFRSFKDQVIFERDEVVKDNGKPYTVFTPYSRKWKAKLSASDLEAWPSLQHTDAFLKQEALPIPSLQQIGFETVHRPFPSKALNEAIIQHYNTTRDFPALENGTSKLGVHLRFGTVSVRAVARKAQQLNEIFLNELIWRDFYHSILWHFPKVGKGHSFKAEYDRIEWLNDEDLFKRWCDGTTGYPIVDAGMRQLNATGFMHNRVRMIVASFLTKHLLINWRWGEAYFAAHLLDYDLASNNGGWQWASGSGCDAAPYFRVFNPYLQTQKFDRDLRYIRKWVPEFREFSYPKPIVVHGQARKRVLDVYAKALKG
ncbi:MAG TPA: deoxyribodipyrimidine photo-lyase [Sediminibacterium sp.]|nr:deoxyribodipyrimidine photo-lyase [Sediminibacterium sp.]